MLILILKYMLLLLSRPFEFVMIGKGQNVLQNKK